MQMTQALRDLGIDDHVLTAEQKVQFDQSGYAVFPEVLSNEQCAVMRARLDEIAREEGARAGTDFHTEAGTTRLGSLVHKDALFDICVTHPLVLASVAYITRGNFGLSSITSRTAHPGEGHQPLHCDFAPGEQRAANALWLLDPFTPDNGPTRLVPGSHRKLKHPGEEMDPAQDHPEQRLILAPAGTLIVIDAFLWHSGTRNRTNQPRHLISAFFTSRGFYQSIAMRAWTPELESRMNPALKYLLDYDHATA